ncbi:PA14 domain-containing protein [Hymenobacter defluvii]|uniref:T9SS type A sorting domain-containing protein n=1 Tax=Hymenobacter defluvii TaxID=2054411 RepID=A0ABS3THX3_9BACT|nr:PA14 domain-containing protein [Hymenobacter defluvii]MBO3273257.1 T9SS type A sorting domain-containing protein [Hymenobacter defluvii]
MIVLSCQSQFKDLNLGYFSCFRTYYFFMGKLYHCLFLLIFLAGFFRIIATQGQSSSAQPVIRVGITAITPSANTGHNYSPWLNDDLDHLVQNVWTPGSFIYSDVTLKLASRTNITRLSLYDWQGVFTDAPAYIYALNGTKRTLLGIFTGETYLNWVDISMNTPVTADAIVVHKYSNNIPQKIKVFGIATAIVTPLAQAIISFPVLPKKTVGDAPFDLAAISNNTATAITYTSSNPAVASITNTTGRWQAMVHTAGTTTITALQTGNSAYLAAANVAQSLTVQAIPPVGTGTLAGKIPIDPQRWYQLTNAPDKIQMLFDGVTNTNVENGWGRIIGTYDSYYPLQPGETFAIESIKFFDGWGSNVNAPMTLSIITDSWQRIPIATFTGEHYGWVGPYPNRPATFRLDNTIRNARYLVITSSWAFPTEMELYGSYTMPTPVVVPSAGTLAAQKQIKLKQSFGVNAFEWDLKAPNNPAQVDPVRLAAMKNFAGIRHYLDWEKLESTQGVYTFNPTPSGGWNFDNMYSRLKQEGVEVLACIKTLPGWLQTTYPANERDSENIPVRYGRDVTLPSSYIEQAKVAFQFAARYGRNRSVNPALLSGVLTGVVYPTDPSAGTRTREIGLDLINYIECDNERDKWWKGRKAYQTPYEYAANLSAFYDGHKNTMGPGVGVKNADPTMQVVMGGLAAPTPDYVKGMVDWCRQNRGYKPNGNVNLCWDIINYHQYSNDAGSSQGGNSTRGAAPEVSDAGRVAKAFVLMAHQYAADMPVWITETGYDLNQGSPLKAVAVGNRSVLETQADWTLRTALAYARWGVERVFLYQLYDDNPQNPIQFGSMGLINSDMTPRPAAQFLNQANTLIGAYTFKQTLNDDPIVDRYELNGQSAYMLVVPDERGRREQYTLNLGSAAYADVYRPTIGSQTMAVQRVTLQNGRLTMQVTETPVFVLAVTSTSSPVGCSATGTILREEWSNIEGWQVATIPTQLAPTSTSQLTQFESLRNTGDNYGARVRGYLCPPQTGTYTFWVAGDDHCELWLSTDDDPTNKVRIASVPGYTAWREWNKYSNQQSASVHLIAGRRYYIEALQKEQGGEDHVAVAWQLPNGTLEAPIPGSRLSPFVATAARASTPSTLSNSMAKIALGISGSAGNKEIELTASPNPFNNECYVQLKLTQANRVALTVYDVQGRLVQELFSGNLEADDNRKFVLKAGNLPAGVYSIKLTTSTEVVHKRVVLNK